MTNTVLCLIARRIKELTQELYTLHQDLEKWRTEPYSAHDRVIISLKIERKVQEIHKWMTAVEDDHEDV